MTNTITGNIDQATRIADEVKAELEKHKKLLNTEDLLGLYFILCQTYFVASDYSRSLSWNNRILNHEDKIIRRDIRLAASLLNLLLHFEMKNSELLDYLLVSTYRSLKKRKQLNKTEIVLLNFIRDLSEIKSRKQLLKRLVLVREELLPLQKNPFERGVRYFNFFAWLDSKIENKEFKEVVSLKNK